MESLTALPSVEGVVDALRAAKDSSNELRRILDRSMLLDRLRELTANVLLLFLEENLLRLPERRRTVLRELYCRHYFFQSEYRGQKIAPVGYVENQQQGEEESTFHERLATCTARLTKELEAEDCVYVLHSGDLICPAGGELSKAVIARMHTLYKEDSVLTDFMSTIASFDAMTDPREMRQLYERVVKEALERISSAALQDLVVFLLKQRNLVSDGAAAPVLRVIYERFASRFSLLACMEIHRNRRSAFFSLSVPTTDVKRVINSANINRYKLCRQCGSTEMVGATYCCASTGLNLCDTCASTYSHPIRLTSTLHLLSHSECYDGSSYVESFRCTLVTFSSRERLSEDSSSVSTPAFHATLLLNQPLLKGEVASVRIILEDNSERTIGVISNSSPSLVVSIPHTDPLLSAQFFSSASTAMTHYKTTGERMLTLVVRRGYQKRAEQEALRSSTSVVPDASNKGKDMLGSIGVVQGDFSSMRILPNDTFRDVLDACRNSRRFQVAPDARFVDPDTFRSISLNENVLSWQKTRIEQGLRADMVSLHPSTAEPSSLSPSSFSSPATPRTASFFNSPSPSTSSSSSVSATTPASTSLYRFAQSTPTSSPQSSGSAFSRTIPRGFHL